MSDQADITHWKAGVPEAPFYAVIFISRKGSKLEGYQELDDLLMTEAHNQPGFLGYSSKGTPDSGIFISYWKDMESIDLWRQHQEHQYAKTQAYARWYDYLHSMICKVESSHLFVRELAEKL